MILSISDFDKILSVAKKGIKKIEKGKLNKDDFFISLYRDPEEPDILEVQFIYINTQI